MSRYGPATAGDTLARFLMGRAFFAFLGWIITLGIGPLIIWSAP